MARLEILSQNRKDLQTQVTRITQTIEKVLDQNASLAERICALFYEQGITIFSILTALSKAISMTVIAITGVFRGGRRGNRRFSTIRPRDLQKMVRQASKCTQKTCRKGR